VAAPSHVDDPTPGIGSKVAIQHALDALPVNLRRVFLLHTQGLDYAQIAGVLGTPVGTVRSRLFRAREALRSSLRAGGERM
jgi:RNA polymerase sigma-70 factor (ECF subfamily)